MSALSPCRVFYGGLPSVETIRKQRTQQELDYVREVYSGHFDALQSRIDDGSLDSVKVESYHAMLDETPFDAVAKHMKPIGYQCLTLHIIVHEVTA